MSAFSMNFRGFLCVSFGIASAIAQSGPAANDRATENVAVEDGVISFSVSTNVPAIEVHGKSTALAAHVLLRRDGDSLKLERVEASLPVKTLETGMAMRDEHMRKYIFTTPSGDVPDLRFESGTATCPGVAPGHEGTCKIAGQLTIRGVSRAFSMLLKVRQEGSSATFHVSGDSVVRLSDYGIPVPSQLGVKTANEVQVHLRLSGKETSAVLAAAEGRR